MINLTNEQLLRIAGDTPDEGLLECFDTDTELPCVDCLAKLMARELLRYRNLVESDSFPDELPSPPISEKAMAYVNSFLVHVPEENILRDYNNDQI
jgi:hypothetical protein